MKKILVIASVTFFLSVSFHSCYYDIEEELYPKGISTCDTTNLSYSADVLPIIQQNCYVCHSTQANQGGIILEGYNNIKVYVKNGQLANAINHTGGISPMPKDAAPLNNCNRSIINRWILNNSPSN